MTKIQFRAWNKEKSIMVYEDEDDSSEYWDGAVGSDVEMVNSILRGDKYIWLRPAGVKDPNGQKIYDGDILKRTVTVVLYGSGKPPEDVVEYLKVEYRDEYAGFFIGESPLFNYIDNTYDVDTGCRCTKPIIVGNIFENPEFLKGGDAQ
ncbi:YopX family protein [Bacillus atrophaeus]|uniref:YopX family protein n=1 Tax=Bacillus atrophaeus TaxID=1452 RepID=UPI0022804D23|nr:YopX family protein [Bacillus atrophaeus]MCY9198106.1 YopX family protein [Bacillus atrophaeus]